MLSCGRPQGELAGLPWVGAGDLRSLYDLRVSASYPRLHRFRCNVCGSETLFFYSDEALYRESLVCGHCSRFWNTPSRARST